VMRFRQRPVVIQALPVSEVIGLLERAPRALPRWAWEAFRAEDLILTHEGILVRTADGWVPGRPGDWLVRGVRGQVHPCRPDIFEASYEPL
jgi:hypothetical protein